MDKAKPGMAGNSYSSLNMVIPFHIYYRLVLVFVIFFIKTLPPRPCIHLFSIPYISLAMPHKVVVVYPAKIRISSSTGGENK
ncbi:hypothetical protein CEXT_719221 [Caerostris extrusa]|uniref:Uncharacterized protein n=1 Tax=Caerostris extrusa TaxID=172846 RepID=A0AAV4QX42_CAEEX|nr:hypothetical protein CEXT_719221 [Caerostris extrusa]